MITPALGGLVIGFVLMLVATVSKEENWRLAYAVVGLIFIFYSLGYFGFGRVVETLLPALTLLFGFLSLYTKGSAQLLSMLITIVLLTNLAVVI
jgi:hypothetical protein